MISGGGRVKFGPWVMFSTYREIKELWKTGWMCQVFGSWSLQLTPQVDRILKGPCCLGASLALGGVVWMLVPSNQTKSPILNSRNMVGDLEFFITSAATFSAEVTLLRIWFRVFSLFLAARILVVKWMGGMNSGLYPYHTSKGDFLVALCCRTLCANSINGINSAQLSCWKLQKMQRYCSSSWLTHLVLPLVCGWKAVDMVNLTPSLLQTSCITFDANWGPLSEITCLGNPVLHQVFSRYSFAISSAVMVLLHREMMVALLNRSTTTNNAS